MLARKATMASVFPMLQAVLDPFMMHTLGLNHRLNGSRSPPKFIGLHVT
jgi:hypothetical protein